MQKKQLSLDEVIKKFFYEKQAGTRQDLIDYINDYMKENEVTANKELINEAARTTVYNYTERMSTNKASISDGAGRPKTYFFMPCDELRVKEDFLKKESRFELAMKLLDYATSHDNMFTKDAAENDLKIPYNKYLSALKLMKKIDLIAPVGGRRSGVFMLKTKDKEVLKNKLWDYMKSIN